MKDLRDTIARASRYDDVVRSTPNDHPGCLACRMRILPGHRHIPLVRTEGYFYTTYDGTEWPALSIGADMTKRDYPR